MPHPSSLCLECEWYGQLYCSGDIIIDLYSWKFLKKCADGKMGIYGRTWQEVAQDPRFKVKSEELGQNNLWGPSLWKNIFIIIKNMLNFLRGRSQHVSFSCIFGDTNYCYNSTHTLRLTLCVEFFTRGLMGKILLVQDQ